MASIAGIQVKSIKHFRGIEGFAEQGNLFMDGKRIGFWSQDADGGEERYEFDKPEYKQPFFDRIKDYYRNNPPVDEMKLCAMHAKDIDMGNLPRANVDDKDYNYNVSPERFMYALMNLCDAEKEWKKAAKAGCSAICIVDYYTTFDPTPISELWNIGKGDINATAKSILTNARKKNPMAHISLYSGPNDFVIDKDSLVRKKSGISQPSSRREKPAGTVSKNEEDDKELD